MGKITLGQINIGNIVVAREGWIGYITKIEKYNRSFISSLTRDIATGLPAHSLTGTIISGARAGLIFDCPFYMVGREFEQIGIYKINGEGEIINATKTIEKLPESVLAWERKVDGVDEKVLNKINELVDAVNRLIGDTHE